MIKQKQKRLIRTGVKVVEKKEEPPKQNALTTLTEEIKQMRHKVDSVISQITTDFSNYHDNFFIDEFIETVGLSQLKQFKNSESHFDRVYETFQRNEDLMKSEKMFNETLDIFREKTKQLFDLCREDKEKIGDSLNSVLNYIQKKEKEMKDDLQKDTYVVQKYMKTNYSEYEVPTSKQKNDKKREKEEKEKRYREKKKKDQQNRFEAFYMNQNMLTKQHFERLEEWSGLIFDDLIFDSKNDDWKSKTTFEEKMKGKKQFIILIETKNGEKFGCFVNNQIQKLNTSFFDNNIFIFSINESSIKKYNIKPEENGVAFKICSNKFDDLFVVGRTDICVKRSNVKSKSSCVQKSFDYNGERNVLCDNSKTFTPKRFSIYQMKEYREDKKIRLSSLMLNEIQQTQIEEWTKKSFGKIMFDSEKESYDKLPGILEHNGQFLMILDTSDDIIIGGYVEGCLTNRMKNVEDTNAFVYSFRNPKGEKYMIKPEKKAFAFETGLHEYYLNFGYNDIALLKNGGLGSIHQDNDSTFDYGHKKRALLGHIGSSCFKPIRVQFIQMN